MWDKKMRQMLNVAANNDFFFLFLLLFCPIMAITVALCSSDLVIHSLSSCSGSQITMQLIRSSGLSCFLNRNWMKRVYSYLDPKHHLQLFTAGNDVHMQIFALSFWLWRTKDPLICSVKAKDFCVFSTSLLFFQSTDMTNVIVNQCWTEPREAHAVPTGHPAFEEVCMSAICCYFGHPLAAYNDTLIHNYWQVVREKIG